MAARAPRSMSALPELLFLLHWLSAVFMAGVIWFVQLVHYPLFHRAEPDSFPSFAIEHARRTGWVVAAPMLLELGTGLTLLVARPAFLAPSALAAGLGLLAVVWLATLLLQIPCHRALQAGFRPETVSRLVLTNWIRTAGWTFRAGLLTAVGAAPMLDLCN
jgi:hypothetical protein